LKESTRRIWRAWIPAIIWLCIITFESTDYLSSDHTSRFLYPVLHFLLGLDPVRFEVWHHYIRKTGHFVGYFTLSCLLFRAWKATLPVDGVTRWVMRWGTVSFLMTALVASLDEWHQTFIPSRTGSVRDVMLDSAAALTAQIVIFLLLREKLPRVSERTSIAL
jgi:VanZ family protein